MIVIKNGIKILNSSNENVFMAVQTASKQSGYSNQYLRKMLRYEKIHGIKIGQLWLVNYVSLHEYIDAISKTNDHRYGPKEKIKWDNK